MEYREDRKGQRLSILGYGCMRFTKNGSAVDLDKAEQELMYAIRHGVNYLDTAYVYAGNEEAVGTILERNHCRKDIFLATKLPHYLIKSRAGAQKKFEEELRRLRTDYKRKGQGRSTALDFPIMVILKISGRCSTHMTGISVRFSITIWMNIPRLDGKDWSMRQRKGFRSSLWSLCAVEGSYSTFRRRQRNRSHHPVCFRHRQRWRLNGCGISRV